METIILIIVLAVVFVPLVLEGGWLLLVRPRRRRRGESPEVITPPEAPGQDELRTPGGEADSAVIAPPPPPPPPPRAPAQPAAPEIEKPPPSAGRLVRLRDRLSRSQSSVGSVLLGLLSRDRLDDDTWDEIEEVLITADVGVAPARQIVEELRTKVKVLGVRDVDQVRGLLRTELISQIGPDLDRTLNEEKQSGAPAVMMMVGVNGTGKTTTAGKLARVLVGDGKTVLLGAADTIRAAAADQLPTWGDRVGAQTVRADREGADPASVAFDAVARGTELKVDVVLVDTAGRLHTKTGLMD